MKNLLIDSLKKKEWIPLTFLAVLTAGVLILSVISLHFGWTTIFQNLFYLPIIFACMYYVWRGFVFSVILACCYCILMAIFSTDPEVLWGALIRFLFFILIAGVITYLSMVRIRIEDSLRESERRLGEIIDFLPDPTFAIDTRGMVIAWNQAIEVLTGRSKSDMLGTGDYAYSSLIYGQKRPVLIDLVQQDNHDQGKKNPDVTQYPVFMRDGNKIIAEAFAQHLNKGTGEHLWIIASPLYDRHGAIAGSIESIRDVTDRKHAEEAFKVANKKLKLLSSITRHDINNQLMVLQGYTGILRSKIPDPEFSTHFTHITEAASRIASMIQFTKTYENIGVNAPAWQELCTLSETAAKEIEFGQIRLKNDLPAATEVFADPLIVKVFYNLMDNAVRHGGKITNIRFSSHEQDGEFLIICEDDGVGVPAEEKEKIFERGFGKNSGLGLFLSKEILDITGITIRETGEHGKGARFEITVPKGMVRTDDGERGEN